MTKQNITYINNNDPVSASVTNKPLSQLNRKTDRLQDQFEATEAGNTLIYRDIPCLETVQVGMPVYWDGEAQLCKPAYISAELNETTNEYQTGKPADCIGLVYKKSSAYSADLLISGLVDFPELSNYLDGGTGRFYLGATPGSLSLTPNVQAFPLGVALGTLGPCDTAYRVYLNPCYTNNVLAHQHYSVDLKAAYWGEVAEDAPEDASFSYNIEQDEELAKLWPPIPVSAVSATIDWDEAYVGGRDQTINKTNSLIQIDDRGIYWVGSQDIATLYSNPDFRITIHFSKVQYSNRNSFVTSLQPDTKQPLKFVNCKGQEASSGELYAQFTLNQDIVESTDYNGKTLQEFTEDWKSKIVPAVNGICVQGNAIAQGTTEDENSFQYNDKTYYTGAVTLDISPYAPDTELAPQIIKVGAAQEREAYGFTYLGLPAGRASSLKLKFEIPANYSTGSINFKLRMQCIAAIDGPYATASIEYYKVARATTAINIGNLPKHIISGNFPSESVEAATIFEVESDPFIVNAGDTVIVVISRSGGSDYNADLAIARITGIMNIVGASNVG